MLDRFQTFFDNIVNTGVHSTGDYLIITYSWLAWLVNFIARGQLHCTRSASFPFPVVSLRVASGLVASGLVETVQSKNKKRRGPATINGDDWYEISYMHWKVSSSHEFGLLAD